MKKQKNTKFKLKIPTQINSSIRIIIGLIIFLSFLYIISIKVDPDLGWHLKIGEWIFNNEAVPHFDKYSYTMSNFRWVDHEWSVDAWLWWMYSNNLWWLTILIFSVLAFVPFFVWIKRCKSFFVLWIIILIAYLVLGFIGVRPQIISFFLFFLVFEILYKKYSKNSSSTKTNKLYLILPIIFLVWANLHAGFFSGLVLFGLFVFVNFLLEWRKTKKFNNSVLKKDFSILVISLFITLINPYTWELYKEIFTVASSFETTKYIQEWKSPIHYFNIYFPALLAVSLVLFVKYFRKYPVQVFIPTLFFLIMYLKSIRMGLLFYVTAIPILTLGAGFLKKEIFAAQKKQPFTSRQSWFFKFIAILLFIFNIGFFIFSAMTYESHTFVLSDQALIALKENIKHTKTQNILNDYGWGGYLIWNAPEIKVFIDGRMPHWVDKNNNSAMKDYVKIFYSEDKNAWKEVFKKNNIFTVIIRNDVVTSKTLFSSIKNRVSPKIINLLTSSKIIKQLVNITRGKETTNLKNALLEKNWEIVYKDEVAVILQCYSSSCF